MITTAPLPPLSGLLGFGVPRADLLAPWLRPGDRGWLLSRSCWSLALLAKSLGRPARVALPAWFCGQSLVPLRRTGAALDFLPVDEAGNADWSRAQGADMAVAVHTFGRRTDLSGLRAAAPLAVEDCAHVLRPAVGIGEVGDAVIYSPHKLLGLPEGAVLVARQDFATTIDALPPAADPFRWRTKRLVQTVLPDVLRPRLPPVGLPTLDDDPAGGEPAPLSQPSALACHLLGVVDFAGEAACRRANALAYRRALDSIAGFAPFFPEDGPAPYRFALRCASHDIARRAYAALRRARLPIESWPDLPPEVAIAPKPFGAAMELRQRILLLPVHSALPTAVATLYAEVLRES